MLFLLSGMYLPALHRITIVFFLLLTFGVEGQNSHERQMIQSINSESNPKKKFSRMMSLAEYYKENNIRRADSLRYVLMKESRKLDDSIRFKALFYFAEIANIRGDRDEYYNTILECQPFLHSVKDDDVQFKIYRHLGAYHSSEQDYETASFYLGKAYKIAKKHNDHQKINEVSRYQALNFMLTNQKDSAFYYADRAINNARRISDRIYLAKAFNTQAKIFDYFGQVELSVAKNLLARQLAEESRDRYLLAKYLREIGQSQKLIYNLDDAEDYFRRSYQYAQLIFDDRQMALALSNIASVQLDRRQFDDAIKNADKAISLLSDLNDYNGLGETHNILGMVYQKQGNFNTASMNYNQALVYFESTNNKEKIAGVYHNVGTIFKEQGKYNNALNYLNRSIEIRDLYGAKNQIYHTYRVIADVYKDIHNTEKSLEYMELYLNYIDSNTTLQAATKIAELSESYRAEQRERLITQQADSLKRQIQERTLTSTQLENSQLRNNFQMYIIVAFLIIMVLAGVVIFYRWNQTKIKQQQHDAEMSQKLLRLQMNPHFVFNAMSVIQSYIFDNDTVNSSKFLVSFSRLMRLILENSPKEIIPIDTEIEILQKYLEIQKLRFQDRFNFKINAEERLFDECVVLPPMITQPFIENSIEHGQLHTIEGGYIHVTFTKGKGVLNITIEDNGIGRERSKATKKSNAHKSMAMDITRQRIDTLNKKYKSEGSLLVEDLNKELQTGTKVLISLPYTVEANPTN